MYFGQPNYKKGHVWDMREHRGWGDSISFLSRDDDPTVVGHTSPRPKVGDLLIVPMQSGNLGLFKFMDITYHRDPPDMWFAKIKGYCYIREDKLVQLRKIRNTHVIELIDEHKYMPQDVAHILAKLIQ